VPYDDQRSANFDGTIETEADQDNAAGQHTSDYRQHALEQVIADDSELERDRPPDEGWTPVA